MGKGAINVSNAKVKRSNIKYFALDKDRKILKLYRFKAKLSKETGVSLSTINRNKFYENKEWIIGLVNSESL